MKVRFIAVVVICTCLALSAATTASTRAKSAQATTLTVWLQEDARDNWAGVVNAANQAFEQSHPGVNVKVEYQTWNQHLTKFDATIAGNNVPDVIELGNTEMTKYMDAKAFYDLTSQKSSIPELAHVAEGARRLGDLQQPGVRRAVLRGRAGRHLPQGPLPCGGDPQAPDEPRRVRGRERQADEEVRERPEVLGAVLPGPVLARRDVLRLRPGRGNRPLQERPLGRHARLPAGAHGAEEGQVDRPPALTGQQDRLTRPTRSRPSSSGRARSARSSANGWEWGLALETKKYGSKLKESQLGAYPMPSRTKGKFMPTFLGGSDLAIPAQSNSKSLAVDWIKAFTSTSSMTQLATQGKVIPNTTSLVRLHNSNPALAPFARASQSSWFVPTAKNWVNVENSRVIRTMLVRIISGRYSVQSEAKKASQQITSILNAN